MVQGVNIFLYLQDFEEEQNYEDQHMHNIQIERGIHPHLDFHKMDIFILTYCVYKTCNDGHEFVKHQV